MAKAKKKRASKYDEKLSIDGSFEDVIRVSVQPGPVKAQEPAKKKKAVKKGK
ncbi:MAG TPA: hypothetical protein VK563_12750 [Puia sp.]|nr:hypothetical protein [Puia sp.]